MMRRIHFFVTAALLAAPLIGSVKGATIDNRIWFDKFRASLQETFAKYYPEAKSTFSGTRLSFEFKTKQFMVRIPSKTGKLQDPTPERGPEVGGIRTEIVLNDGRYLGALVIPQTFDREHYKILLLAPYSELCECHLYTELYYPAGTNPKFIQDFTEKVERFERLLTPPNK